MSACVILGPSESGSLAAVLAVVFLLGLGAAGAGAKPPSPPAGSATVSGTAATLSPELDAAVQRAVAALRAKHGQGEAERIERGVAQAARYWRAEDGTPAELAAFAEAEFLPRGNLLDRTFERLESAFESLDGYFVAVTRDLRRGLDLEIGPMLPIDQRLGAWDVAAHVAEDQFRNRIAFVGLLNFPLTTLAERLEKGGRWSRREWAEVRLAQRFSTRVPAEVNARIAAAYASAEDYVNKDNVYTHHLLTRDGRRLFPAGQRLIVHWNLRDEIKARYADKEGLPRQRMIQLVMEKIVRQEIPGAVVNNPLLDWTPETGAVAVSPVKDTEAPAGSVAEPRAEREPDERYRRWMGVFQAERAGDPFHPETPNFVDRRFDEVREIPQAQVEALLTAVLDSPLGPRVGELIRKRLGRPLEPFDVWYAGFRPRSRHTEAELDALTRKRYPTPEAYAADIPRLLTELGFTAEKARFLAEHMVVDPSRGPGHALGHARRDDKAHLRTRVNPDGMDYKGYNIAVHEMGHNVEQVFSTTTIDHTLLRGVPNNAFTEALAFVFQAQDLRLLGLGADDPASADLETLEDFWGTREIAGVGLLDIRAWRWLYQHPEATPAQFREAVLEIARGLWQRYYAPILGGRDVTLLGIYSHLVGYGLYMPDYPLGHLIAFQVEEHFRKSAGAMGAEFERLARIGSLTPDAWMREAVGGPLSAEPLLQATERALAAQSRPGAKSD